LTFATVHRLAAPPLIQRHDNVLAFSQNDLICSHKLIIREDYPAAPNGGSAGVIP
jgi:hypothetical protein